MNHETMMVQEMLYMTHRRHSDQYLDATSLSRTSCVAVLMDILSGITDVLESVTKCQISFTFIHDFVQQSITYL
jgi:hypothetical protein